MASFSTPIRSALTLALPALLAACGGGGGGGDPAPAGPPVVLTAKISGVAADGPLHGATACYDLNDNGACDAAEPSGPTDANGNFSFDVAAAEAGKHRVVVNVPATAVDKDTGAAVGAAFTLMSPATGNAAQSVFASPLSTLVQAHMDNTGATLDVATDFIKAQAGLTLSPLADFTGASDADTKQAATLARLLVLTTQQQTAAVASVVGTVDVSGAAITPADLGKAVTQAVIAALPTIAALAADPSVANASGAAQLDELRAAAQTAVAQIGLTPQTVAAAVGVTKLPPDVTETGAPAAGALLTALRYTNADSWFVRTLEASAADNTPDANNMTRYYDVRKESVPSGFSPAGTVYAWGFGGSRARAGDLHWNGSAWVGCPLGTRSASTVRDSQGRSTYGYCDGHEEGSTVRTAVDLTGKSIATVFRDTIRMFPGGANGVNFADWGPADLGLFGTATFPADSKLYYQNQTTTKAALAYDVQPSAYVNVYSDAVAAGGDSRQNASLACAAPTAVASPVATLDALVATNPGKPCIFNKSVVGSDSSLDPNEWWSNSTASLGDVANGNTLPAGTGNWYNTTARLRVAFAPTGNATTYYSCLYRSSNGSSRNCTAIGTGAYAIQTLGDARVMTFTGLPAATQSTGFTRIFVERGGKVYYGYQSPVGGNASYLRLNLPAANAVLKPLGLPPIRPVTQASDFGAATLATMATLKGVWGGATDTAAVVFRFGDGGRFLMAQGDAANPDLRGQTGSELGFFDIDATTGLYSTLLSVDSNLTEGTSHPNANSTFTATATQLISGGAGVFPRLPSDTSGLVGLWAASPTDLSAPHFAFFANGKFLMIDSRGDTSGGACTQAQQGPPGAEFASYTFNAATGALRVFGKIYDTNGCAGVFDSSAGAIQSGTANTEANGVIVFAPDGMSATFTTAGETPMTLYRIATQ